MQAIVNKYESFYIRSIQFVQVLTLGGANEGREKFSWPGQISKIKRLDRWAISDDIAAQKGLCETIL